MGAINARSVSAANARMGVIHNTVSCCAGGLRFVAGVAMSGFLLVKRSMAAIQTA